ncbi:MAG: TAXI family TRAP transporter solute-binding subunit [Candidatus Competibacteraceae bacterium]|jgi:TRAP transporter TAXI family solute receptor|nr:TAXI family TRAP transporter solute-binding subunit [Candidatus Competibacteraceae bacterium]
MNAYSISTRIKIVVLLLIGLFYLTPAGAEEGVGMVTGSKTGTYYQFGKNIAEVAKPKGVDILVKDSKGSIDNIKRLNSRENAAFGIVQSDVLGFLERSKSAEMQTVAKRLRLIFPFYNEEVHLFANKSINTFEDLQGKRLVVGEKESGNWLTSTNLLEMTGVEPAEQVYMPPKEAAVAVLKGEVDAMIYVAGKPVTLFTALGNLKEKPDFAPLFDNIHFVPLEDTIMLREYAESGIGPEDYPWIGAPVSTIAVKAVLMSFDFSSKRSAYFQQRCQDLAGIGQAIRANIDQLKKTGHPKWNEVDLDAEVGNWQRDTCSQSAETGAKGSKTDISKELEKLLLNQLILKQGVALVN